jgi:NAD(P)-dependent dehydrogenase (short-subunit alcohol dehydrogenase family)
MPAGRRGADPQAILINSKALLRRLCLRSAPSISLSTTRPTRRLSHGRDDTAGLGQVHLRQRRSSNLSRSGMAALPPGQQARHSAERGFRWGVLLSPNIAMYTAAKAGLMSPTRSMSAAYADRGIRVNALTPGGCSARDGQQRQDLWVQVGPTPLRIASGSLSTVPHLMHTAPSGALCHGWTSPWGVSRALYSAPVVS